jgi:competence protein ComEC
MARCLNIPLFFLYASCSLSLILALFFLREKVKFNALLSLSILFLGSIFYQNFQLLPPDHIINFTSKESRLVYLRGIILDEPILTSTSYGEEKTIFVLETRELKPGSDNQIWQGVRGRVKVTAYGKRERYSYSDELLLGGYLSRPEGPRNPGGFNYKEYLARQRIYTLLRVKQENLIKSIGEGGNPFVKFTFGIKEKLRELIKVNLPQLEGSLLSAIILGDREDLPEELNDFFIKTGTVHILAISGLHVGIVAFIFLSLFKVLRVPRKLRYVLVIFLLIIYAFLTGARPPVIRATIMALVLLFGLLINRDIDIYNSLGLAALIILMGNPLQLFDAGFQLSFLCVISILYFTPKMASIFKDKNWLTKYFFVSLSAWLGIIPVVAYHFNIISPMTVIANLAVIPFIFLVVALGFTFILAGLLSLIFAKVFGATVSFALSVLIHFTSIISKLPFSYFYIPQPTYIYIICYYVLLLVVFNYKRLGLSVGRLSILVLVTLNFLIWKGALRQPNDKLKVTFFDVGYGDAAFVEFPKSGNMLIDAGEGQDADKGRWVIMPFLRSKGINTIDAIVLSHPDEDHVGGLYTIIKNFKVKNLFDNGMPTRSLAYANYIRAIKEENVFRRILKEGNQIKGYNALVYILHPPTEFLRNTRSDTNNNSLILKIIYKDIGILFCGDIEEEAMKRLIPYGWILNSSIIKIPHHGADAKEEGELFFREVNPKIAIISVTKDNRFNAPSIKTLELLEGLGAKVYQTDTYGAIIVSTDGKSPPEISTFIPPD